jgi:hypothetical protein
MKTVSDLSERVPVIPQAYFGEAQQAQGSMAHGWFGGKDSWDAAKSRGLAVSTVSRFTSAAWGDWPDRGIPELASPLAD